MVFLVLSKRTILTPLGPTPWLLEIEGQWQYVSLSPLTASNFGVWLIQKEAKGEGIIMLPHWVLKPYLDCVNLQL